MSTDETNDEINEFSDSTPSEPAESAPETNDIALPKPGWSRRTFLKAAALGAAGAALLNKGGSSSGGIAGWHLGAATALANDLSNYPCTAQDINVLPGTVINEPCAANTCNGTFCALVAFPVQNSTSTGRYCITLHLVGANGVPSQDVLLRTDYAHPTGSCAPTLTNGCPTLTGTSTIGGKSGGGTFNQITMYGIIQGFPCSAQQVCFGAALPASFTGKCTSACSTISFSTTPGDANCASGDQSPPKGQCRHEQICVTGFGVTLSCADANCNPTNATTCAVQCGQPLKLVATSSGGTGTDANCLPSPCPNPPANTLSVPNGSGAVTQTDSVANGVRTTCFTVQNPQDGTYTVTATDCNGCTRTASIPVTTTQVTQPTLSVVSSNPCTGATVFQIAPCPPQSGVTYSFTDCNGNPLNGTYNAANCQYSVTLPQGATTCVMVTASNGTASCNQTAQQPVTVPPALSVGAPVLGSNPCSGLAQFTATASGGTGPYTYSFSGPAGTTSGNTFTVSPQIVNGGGINTACQTLTVTATDANGCQATNSVTFSQCVSTTAGC